MIGTIANSGRPARILLVEDDHGDVLFTQKAFSRLSVPLQLDVLHDGEAVMRYVQREGEFQDKPLPDLILLDINIPKKSGLEVLAAIKQDAALYRIPVIMLTCSSASKDIKRAYDARVNGYVVKPVDFDDFCTVLQSISLFWLQTNAVDESASSK